MSKIIVVGNGPSSLQFRGKLEVHKLYGCNKGFLDFPLHTTVVRDRPAVMEIDKHYKAQLPDNIYTLARYLENRRSYELSEKWQALEINSGLPAGRIMNNAGVVALQLAHAQNPGEPIYCVGFDSVMTGTTSTTNYDYKFRTNAQQISNNTSISHRKKVMACVESLDTDVYFVWPEPFKILFKSTEKPLNTITPEQFEKEILGCNTNDTNELTLPTGGTESDDTLIQNED